MKQNNETIKATIKAFIDKISEVAQKNDLQLIFIYDGLLALQPKCYRYTCPEDTENFDYLPDIEHSCHSYVIGGMETPSEFDLLDSIQFKCITHYYYLKVKRVLRECKKLQDYMVSNGITMGARSMGYDCHDLWECWAPHDTPIYVLDLHLGD